MLFMISSNKFNIIRLFSIFVLQKNKEIFQTQTINC